MSRASWHPLARRELFEASGFYEAESGGLGEAFLDAVELAIEDLERHPQSGPIILREIRWLLIRRFPYSLIYRIQRDPRDPNLHILAVAHHRRRPRYWVGRV